MPEPARTLRDAFNAVDPAQPLQPGDPLEPLDVSLLEVELTGPVDKLLPILRERLADSYLIPSPEAEAEHEAERVSALREGARSAAGF
jgi:hypothetical protein